MSSTIDIHQFDQLVIQRLPTLMRQNRQIQELVLELARENFAGRKETEDRFYQLLEELKRDREERSHQWKEYTEEQSHKWKEYSDEQSRKWREYMEEQARQWKEYTKLQDSKWEETRQEFQKVHEAIMKVAQKQEHNFSAVGSRWGIKSENSFRNALAGILEHSFGVKVLNINDYDHEGTVFGRPEQVELDVIIKNGLLVICEIKSSVGKADMYIFERKVRFYEKQHQQKANRMLVISPMVEDKARKIAQTLGIEVYSDSSEVNEL